MPIFFASPNIAPLYDPISAILVKLRWKPLTFQEEKMELLYHRQFLCSGIPCHSPYIGHIYIYVIIYTYMLDTSNKTVPEMAIEIICSFIGLPQSCSCFWPKKHIVNLGYLHHLTAVDSVFGDGGWGLWSCFPFLRHRAHLGMAGIIPVGRATGNELVPQELATLW